jgi:hypothetical protein
MLLSLFLSCLCLCLSLRVQFTMCMALLGVSSAVEGNLSCVVLSCICVMLSCHYSCLVLYCLVLNHKRGYTNIEWERSHPHNEFYIIYIYIHIVLSCLLLLPL